MRKQRVLTVSFILLLGLFLNQKVRGQILFIDTLKQIMTSNISDTLKIDKINDIVEEKAIQHPEYTVQFSNYAIAIADSIKDSVRLSRSINRKGIAYYYLGDYNKAIDYYFKSAQINEKINRLDYLASDYNNIGLVLIEENLYNEALDYFYKVEDVLAMLNRPDLLARVYDNIGISYYNLNQYDTALVWFQRSYKINKAINQKKTLASNIKNIGNVLMNRGDYILALAHFDSALAIYNDLNIKLESAGLLDKIGLVYTFLGKYNDAEKSFAKAGQQIAEVKSSTLHLQNLKSLAKFYELRGDLRSAQQFTSKYIHFADSLQNADKRKKYEQLQALVANNDKIKELQILKKLNTAQKETIRNQRIIQYGIFVLLVFSLLIIALAYNAIRTRNRTNKMLEDLVTIRTSELKIAKEKAEESDRNKSVFLANISHEVRTPMNAIIGFSDLLLHRNIEQHEREEYVFNLQKGTLNLLKIFDKITYLSQIEGSNQILIKTEINVDTLFQELKKRFEQAISDCKIPVTIDYTIPENLKYRSINTYSGLLEKVLNELLENAVKFTVKGEIHFGMYSDDKSYKYFVKDSGIGIEPNHKDKIFDNFTKFATSNCNLTEGAGIGLFIVRKNLELVGGSIDIHTSKDEGTLVEVTIPM